MTQLLISDESTLTDRYQTTIPNTIRKALGLNKQDKIHYDVLTNGSVVISRAELPEKDPVIEKFLHFLSNDLKSNPQNIKSLDTNLSKRIENLDLDTDIDLDEKLTDDD